MLRYSSICASADIPSQSNQMNIEYHQFKTELQFEMPVNWLDFKVQATPRRGWTNTTGFRLTAAKKVSLFLVGHSVGLSFRSLDEMP